MPLEQLYNKSPMEQYGGLSLGLRMGMGPEEFGQYETRQQEYNRQIDELNRRASEINPHIVEQQRLENQKNQYLMPTHQYKGMEAQTQISTPGYLQGKVDSELAVFGKTGAEANLAAKTAQGQLPYAEETAATQGQMTLNATQNAAFYQLLTNPQLASAKPEEAKAWISKRMPNQADRFNALVDQLGVQGAATAVAKQMEQMALIDPKLIQDVYKLKNTPKAAGSMNEVELAMLAAGGDPVKAWNMRAAAAGAANATPKEIQLARKRAELAKRPMNQDDLDWATTNRVETSVVETEDRLEKDPVTGEVVRKKRVKKTPGETGSTPQSGALPKGAIAEVNAPEGTYKDKNGKPFVVIKDTKSGKSYAYPPNK